MFASIKYLHNFRDARATEHSDLDRFVHIVVRVPKLDFSSRALSQIVLRREPVETS